MSSVADKINTSLKNGFQTQKEIATFLGISQSAVSKHLRKIADDVLTLPESRPIKYALPSSINGNEYKYTFCEIDSYGKQTHIGQIYTLKNGQFFVSLDKSSSPLYLGEKKNGLYDDLPYFLDDLRPQGFIGNQIAKQLHSLNLEYPKNLARWSPYHILKYLIQHGDNLPGNLIFFDRSFSSINRSVSPITTDTYNFMAKQAETGTVPNSSAAGEQQKFTAFNKDLNAHVLVKFTSDNDNDLTRRWKDVLVTEYHALKTLAKFNIPAAEVRLIEADNRFYLETKRFDRVGINGRSSLFSLMSIDMEFAGVGDSWLDVFDALNDADLVINSDRLYIRFLVDFSRFIGNTDTHLGNISFRMDGNKFSLMPIYDMCSMAIAPSTNSIKPISISLPSELAFSLFSASYSFFGQAVKLFWQSVYHDERISQEFKDYIANQRILKSWVIKSDIKRLFK